MAPGTEPERVAAVLEKMKKACLVTASLSTPVRMEPEVREVEPPVLAHAAR